MTNVNNGSWKSFYYPFGARMDATGDDNKYTFTGKEYDDESSLHYYWNRYYDSQLGRFISVDPKWQKYPTLTSYHYCNNNPLKYVDPSGEEGLVVTFGIYGQAASGHSLTQININFDVNGHIIVTQDVGFGKGGSHVPSGGTYTTAGVYTGEATTKGSTGYIMGGAANVVGEASIPMENITGANNLKDVKLKGAQGTIGMSLNTKGGTPTILIGAKTTTQLLDININGTTYDNLELGNQSGTLAPADATNVIASEKKDSDSMINTLVNENEDNR